jgi:hypothetical protein
MIRLRVAGRPSEAIVQPRPDAILQPLIWNDPGMSEEEVPT